MPIFSKQNGALLFLVVISLFNHPDVQDFLPQKTLRSLLTEDGSQNGSNNNLQDALLTEEKKVATGLRSTIAATTPATTPSTAVVPYQASPVEKWVLKHGEQFRLQRTTKIRKNMADGCQMWRDPNATSYYNELQQFRTELADYSHRLASFNRTIKDLRKHLGGTDDVDRHAICDTLELHPDGLPGIFPSGMLSKVPGGGGWAEPLLPPLRHPEICFQGNSKIMDMGYLVHDFASLCRKLQPHSRTVFIDMGASLDFHAEMSPAVYVTKVYQQFGFQFDHIYGYEVVPKEPQDVYQRIPDDLKAAYHWYNVGVDADIESSQNPLKLLLETFNEDDFVVIKLGETEHSIREMGHFCG